MKLQLIRNATLLLDYAGVRFLIDPMLAEQGAYPGFPNTPNNHRRNPTVGLPVPASDLTTVDAVLVTHTHPDHWDAAAQALLPKHLPVFVQHAQDQALIQSQGFTNVRLFDGAEINGVQLTQTGGQHGTDAALAVAGDFLGQVSGIVFRHPQEKSLYVAGDTLWNHFVQDALAQYHPEVVVLNAGDAQAEGLGSIIMTKEEVLAVYQAAPQATLVVCHQEAVNHALLTRAELRAYAAATGMTDRLLIPEDGEALTL